MEDFSHFDESGRAHMVDITAKGDTVRTATATGRVLVNEETFRLIRTGGMKKGDVLGTAQIAGIMGAKRTPDIIPMCHPILLKGVDVSFSLNETDLAVEITATARFTGATGVEMEALTAVSVAALTVYDMWKAVDRAMELGHIHLEHKSRGRSGDFYNPGRGRGENP